MSDPKPTAPFAKDTRKLFTVSISRDLYKRFKEFALTSGRRRSVHARRALEEYLERQAILPKESNRLFFLVEFDRPFGTSIEWARQFVDAALRTEAGLRTPEDPMTELDRNSIKVLHMRGLR